MNDGTDEALQRARTHLHRATLEGLQAARALLEAAMQTSGLADASRESLVGNLQSSLDNLIAGIRENSTIMLPKALAEPLAVALEAEIKRWEERSQTDPDARPVLRAFLGLRELLWELGLGRDATPTKDRSRPNEDSGGRAQSHRDRVRRFDVED